MNSNISDKDKKDWRDFLEKNEISETVKKLISGDPDKIKKIYDTWVFSRDTSTNNPNWQLVDTLT